MLSFSRDSFIYSKVFVECYSVPDTNLGTGDTAALTALSEKSRGQVRQKINTIAGILTTLFKRIAFKDPSL